MPAEFGATPWGRAWLRTIESPAATRPNPALPRARSLARNDAVTLTIATGLVHAEVTTSGATNRVRLDIPRWPDRSMAEADRLVAEALADHRSLALGDLPDDLEARLRRHEIDVAVPLDELSADCDCRTRRRFCAHVMATVYVLTQRIDERPALAIELRSARTSLVGPSDPDWISLSDLDVATFYGG